MDQHHYKIREVRDLAWACFSQPLFHSPDLASDKADLANCGLRLTPARQDWLARLDKQPAALLKHLQQRHNQRLGLYFESLWHFFLQCDEEVELLAHNLPVRDGGKTLGEFDCLYYCRSRKQHFHLELAVKYYLSQRKTTQNLATSQWQEWLGPTNTDQLDRKITHLTGHQIKLGEQAQARKLLHQLGIESLRREIEIKGYLFQSQADPLAAPHGYNCGKPLCNWLTIDALPAYLQELRAGSYCVLAKPHWLAPALASVHIEGRLGGDQLEKYLSQHLNRDGRPVLVAAFAETGYENQRFFVTGPHWPTHSG